jgi:hypothetical protein
MIGVRTRGFPGLFFKKPSDKPSAAGEKGRR